MKNIFNIIIIILVVLLQITILKDFSVFGSMINLPLIVMMSLILIKRNDLAIWWVASGLLLDLLSPTQFGCYSLAFVIVYLLSSFVVKRLFYELSLYLVMIFFIFGSVIIDIPFLYYNFSLQILLVNFILNTVVGCIIYWFIKFYLEPQSIIKVKI